MRVASQQVGAGLMLIVAADNAEIIHQAGTQAGGLHGKERILTYRYDDTFLSGYIRANSHIYKQSHRDEIRS